MSLTRPCPTHAYQKASVKQTLPKRNPPPCRKKPVHEDDPLPTRNPPPSNTCHSGAHQDPPQHVTHLRKPCTPAAPCRQKAFHEDDPLATRNPSPSNTCHSGAHQDPPSMSPTYANPALQKPAETRHHGERKPSMKMTPWQPETLHPATPAIREPTKTPPACHPPTQTLHSRSLQKPTTMSKETLP